MQQVLAIGFVVELPETWGRMQDMILYSALHEITPTTNSLHKHDSKDIKMQAVLGFTFELVTPRGRPHYRTHEPLI